MSDTLAHEGSGGSTSGAGREPPSAWRRLLWLSLPVGYWVVASRVPLPGVDAGAVGPFSALETPRFNLLSVGLPALVAGYVLVEIGAAVVPAWRPLRRTRRGRASLAPAAFLGAMITAVGVAFTLLSPATESGLLTGSWWMPIVSLLGATALLWIVVHATDRRSGGSALALLAGLSGAFELARGGVVEAWLTAGEKDLPQPVTSILLSSLALAMTVVVLRSRVGDGAGDGGPSVRVPVGGLAPFWGAQSLLPLVIMVLVSSKVPGLPWYPGFTTAVLAGLVVVVSLDVLAWRATSSALVGALVEGRSPPPEGAPVPGEGAESAGAGVGARGANVSGEGAESAGAGVAEEADGAIGAAYAPPREPVAAEGPRMTPDRAAAWAARTRGLLLRAAVPTMAYLALVAWPAWPVLDHPDRSGRVVGAMAGACLLVAVVLDLIAETRFRLAHPGAVSLLALHHAGSADGVVTALGDAQVPAFARNVHARTLLSFVGPFAPIDILVPASKVPVAGERLAGIFPVEPELEPPPPEAAPGKPEPSPKRPSQRKRRKRPASEDPPEAAPRT